MTVESVFFTDVDEDEVPPKKMLRVGMVVGRPDHAVVRESIVYFGLCEYDEHYDGEHASTRTTAGQEIGVYLNDLRAALDLLEGPAPPPVLNMAQVDAYRWTKPDGEVVLIAPTEVEAVMGGNP